MSYMTLPASPLSTIALLFLSYLAYRITQSFITRRRFHAFAQQHGCEEPPDVTGPFPFKSWLFVWRMMCVFIQKALLACSLTRTHNQQARRQNRRRCIGRRPRTRPPEVPHPQKDGAWIFSLDLVEDQSRFATIVSLSDNTLKVWLIELSQAVDGSIMIQTCDPANMQAMLASQFTVSCCILHHPMNGYVVIVVSTKGRPDSPY